MSAILKSSKGKRHGSSSSLAGALLEGTISERKSDIKEMDDQFAIAEARCEELQEKIDVVKVLKRKSKLKRRSMTRVTENQMVTENVPYISVRTQPKKKVSQQAARLRRPEGPSNSTQEYLDPASYGQHRMIDQNVEAVTKQNTNPIRSCVHAGRASGDGGGTCGRGCKSQPTIRPWKRHVAMMNSTIPIMGFLISDVCSLSSKNKKKKPNKLQATQGKSGRSGLVQKHSSKEVLNQIKERAVVELFNKSRHNSTPDSCLENIPKNQSGFAAKDNDKALENQMYNTNTGLLSESTKINNSEKPVRTARRIKHCVRRYESSTVASRMKQIGARYYNPTTNTTKIPFVVSKSTTPSHNIGVNIQQVLSGLKTLQPLSGIPSTIAHHMGLGHLPAHGTRSDHMAPVLGINNINSIRLDGHLVHLPTYKSMSYRRLLTLYREGEGLVPRYLRAISRPSYFYTSMYNLKTNPEDLEAATSTGQGGGQEVRQSLAEYAALYREYEQLEKSLRGRYNPELSRRRDELQSQLVSREEHIRKVVQGYENTGEIELTTLRASASIAEEGYRQSMFKLNSGDA